MVALEAGLVIGAAVGGQLVHRVHCLLACLAFLRRPSERHSVVCLFVCLLFSYKLSPFLSLTRTHTNRGERREERERFEGRIKTELRRAESAIITSWHSSVQRNWFFLNSVLNKIKKKTIFLKIYFYVFIQTSSFVFSFFLKKRNIYSSLLCCKSGGDFSFFFFF